MTEHDVKERLWIHFVNKLFYRLLAFIILLNILVYHFRYCVMCMILCVLVYCVLYAAYGVINDDDRLKTAASSSSGVGYSSLVYMFYC